jgi:hypothetical protein
MKEKSGTISIVVVTIAALNGLFLFGNGLFMLVAPLAWYYFVPGVTHTSPFNQHFIRDIGLIQMFLGAAFGVAMIRPASRFVLWAAATSWLIAHAILHLWEVAVGICSPSTILRDFPAVTLPALIGIVLTTWAWGKAQARPHATS